MDKTLEKVKGWQGKLLNMARRCTLIKSVLNTYPLYSMQTSILPSSILCSLEKGCRRFLWNKVDSPHYMPRISWNNVTRPMSMGGLGIHKLKEWNLAFMAKLGWRILNSPDKLWVRLFKDKYLRKTAFLDSFPSSNNSPIWRDILKGRDVLKKGLIVGIGNGNSTSLWYHHWVADKPLYLLMDKEVPESKAHWFVGHIIKNGAWVLDDIKHLITEDIQNAILAVPLARSQNQEDFLRWRFTTNGVFSIKSAYFSQCASIWNNNIASFMG